MPIPDQGKYQGVNPYTWMVTLRDKRQLTAASFNPRISLRNAIATMKQIVHIDFTSGDRRYPRIGFNVGEGIEVVFGVYHWNASIEWCGQKDSKRPDSRRWTVLIGWRNKIDNRRFVAGVNLATGFVELQGD
jgi:hypothetical protein